MVLETPVGGQWLKGPRLYDWAYVELADIDASEYDASRSGLWTRGLLIRRTIADQDPAGPPLVRWSIQEIRRVATRLSQRRIEPARIIAWPLWRRAHQASAEKRHLPGLPSRRFARLKP